MKRKKKGNEVPWRKRNFFSLIERYLGMVLNCPPYVSLSNSMVTKNVSIYGKVGHVLELNHDKRPEDLWWSVNHAQRLPTELQSRQMQIIAIEMSSIGRESEWERETEVFLSLTSRQFLMKNLETTLKIS